MRETPISARIAKALVSRGAFVVNLHGSPMQRRGMPDLLVCFRGTYFAIEVKVPGKTASKIQEYTMHEIELAGGVTGVATSVEEALNVLRSTFTDV